MVRANQNSPDSPAAGHRPSRLGTAAPGRPCRHGYDPASDRGSLPHRQGSRGQLVVGDAPALPGGRSAGVPSVTSSWEDTQHQTRRGPNVPTHAMTSAPTLRHHKRVQRDEGYHSNLTVDEPTVNRPARRHPCARRTRELGCSRPHSKRFAESASARGASALSPQPRWSYSTGSTTAPHDLSTAIGNDSLPEAWGAARLDALGSRPRICSGRGTGQGEALAHFW
jgi:hypothetical protein